MQTATAYTVAALATESLMHNRGQTCADWLGGSTAWGEHQPKMPCRIAPSKAGTARRTVRSIRLRSAGAATRSNCVGSHSGLQPVSIPRQRKLLSPDGCRRRAFSFWPLRADPAVARSGHADAWRFASIQESTLLVTRTGSILVRAPSPRGGACRLVMPSVANMTGQAYARTWTN